MYMAVSLLVVPLTINQTSNHPISTTFIA